MEDLPNEFDLIVIGTGFNESVIAAAASRVGKTVLHIDENDFYGGFWSSFNFDNFVSHVNKSRDDEKLKSRLRNAEEQWFEFSEDHQDVAGWNKEKIMKDARRFNIDLIPKMNFSNGSLVDLLIKSNICRYTEFRAVDKVLTVFDGEVDIVPGSRSDVFTKKNVSIIEKRLLMKFMTQCVEFDKASQDEGERNDFLDFPEDGQFIDLMKQQRLPPKLVHFILYAMCMGNEELTFKDGIRKIRTYLTSIGRYGNTPFLFPMYGCGEIPQCFCRLCAVFGGVYCLSKPIESVKIVHEEKVEIQCGEQKLSAKKLVHGLASNVLESEMSHEYLSRAIIITVTPFGGSSVNSESDGGGVVLLYHPIEGRADGITMIQQSHFSGCVPKGLYLIHLSTPTVHGARKDFEDFVGSFLRNDADPSGDFSAPTILYQAYFEIPSSRKDIDHAENQNGPIYSCCGVFSELDYDESINQARKLYEKMYPEDEFLPKAPEPEEIIIGDEDPADGTVNLGVLADLVEPEADEAKKTDDSDQTVKESE